MELLTNLSGSIVSASLNWNGVSKKVKQDIVTLQFVVRAFINYSSKHFREPGPSLLFPRDVLHTCPAKMPKFAPCDKLS